MNTKLKTLAEKMRKGGWNKIRKGLLPRPYIYEYIEATHPEIIEEFAKWFEEEVRN